MPPAEADRHEKEATFDLWEENVEALDLFCQSTSQWRVGPGGPYGFDYQGVDRVLEWSGITMTRELFGKLRTMERAALKCMSKQEK